MSDFNRAEREAIYRVMRERRDMRHFLSDPVDPVVLTRLLNAAHLAPSVGMMQPWRILRITDSERRQQLHALVQREREATAEVMGERQAEFLRLKVEGIVECGELLVVALTNGRERHVFGRRTMPEMDLASTACAIQNLWLAARAEGLGMGWVSLFNPDSVATLLGMPSGAKPVAILCLGHVEAFYSAPMLEITGWAEKRPLHELIDQNTWDNEKA